MLGQPRKAPPASDRPEDQAMFEYLVAGDREAVVAALRPLRKLLLLFRPEGLQAYWAQHRDAIRAEAKRRRLKRAHGEGLFGEVTGAR
jgi:hypothetical protein